MLKITTLFSGIGAFEKALFNLGLGYELVNFCEFDKYAVQSYCAIHSEPTSKNLGDITKVDIKAMADFDLLTYGFPCQDISNAGKMRGIIEGETRSGLLFEALKIIKEKKPKFAIAENVKNLVGKKFRADFDNLLNELSEMGYNNYWKVLNAKDFGIPQNRERVFIISIRKDVDSGNFQFPIPFRSDARLKDVLEDEVNEKFYISSSAVDKIVNSNFQQEKCRIQAERLYYQDGNMGALPARNGGDKTQIILGDKVEVLGNVNQIDDEQVCIPCLTPERLVKRQNGRRFKEDGDPAFTITSQDRHGVLISEATKKGYAEASEGDSINIAFPNSASRRGRVQKGIAGTLETSCNQAVINDFRIRKLTPKECFRLMGFTDEDFQKCVDVGVSNSQLYKQAGNSIVVPVLEGIFRSMQESKMRKEK